ncbi:MAG: tRNA (adenosine(37)-N6)-threonylcarbamoyltransferase complex ATPase subunit type 1 TsaE [Pseudomonadales bacterium]|nr:tRNA (adenosine(37)-N6)-threonylcarbamoyltransferase complex ATPase subunit type 1 TsaE [Pseudomonadales bacterium]
MKDHQLFLSDEEATISFGKDLARATFGNTVNADKLGEGIGTETIGGVIHLNGELGAGKTTLTRGIMRGYGYNGAVKSPTYTLVEPYEFEKCHIYHFDLYRLANPVEVEYLGTEDYFQSKNLCIVEWANRGAGIIPSADLTIDLETEGTGRQLNCQIHSEKGLKIAKRLWK